MATRQNGSTNPSRNSGNMTEQAQRMSAILEFNSNELNQLDRASGKSIEQRISDHSAAMSRFSSDDDLSVSSRTNSDREGRAEDKRSPEIAARENAQVKCGKFLVFAVLLAATVAVGFLTYWYITEEEKEDYQQQFQTDAKELIDISNSNGRNIMAVLNIFATLLSSTAIQSNATWPFYTLPNFEQFGQQSRELSGSLLLAFAPRVGASDRAKWEEYSVEHQEWVKEGLTYLGMGDRRVRPIADFIYRKTTRSFVPELNFTSYNPVWQLSPAPTDTSVINFNLFNHPAFKRLVEFSDFTREAAISEVLDTFLLFGNSAPQKGDDPQSLAVLPVFAIPGDKSSEIVGHVVAVIPWGQFFTDILQEGHEGVFAVLKESCGNSFTYMINGADAEFLGTEDLHDERYTSEGQSTEFVVNTGNLTGLEGRTDHCEYTISVYPSETYEEDYKTTEPIYFTLVVVLVFLFTSSVFVLYDWCVMQRQNKVNKVAVQSTAIVSGLFPEQVRDKLFQMDDGKKKNKKKNFNKKANVSEAAAAAGLDIDNDEETPVAPENATGDNSAPIADLFPSATVLFMDIAGFTAWSSQREPSQVFTLLETIYKNFDRIAKKRNVFKVETIGDCYLAVCGLPEPCDDHAVVMARFARDCLEKMTELAHELESTLGPDTADLVMRAGLHSGPVTAGVLRGDRARFQLFGDTVNTASRMESTGIKAKIHISQETAELIAAAGKGKWVIPREDMITAKGKGQLKTFWLLPRGGAKSQIASSVSGDTELTSNTGGSDGDHMLSPSATTRRMSTIEAKTKRLVEFSSDILLQTLNKIATKRGSQTSSAEERSEILKMESELGKNSIALEEVTEVISLPSFDSSVYKKAESTVSEEVRQQLFDFVHTVASMYCENPFHNFDHALHVTQSVSKLLSRIVAIKELDDARELHDHTYGITSDPLTQFAIVFSSLIHDVDHRGVPNALLMREDPEMAALYKNQAVAEQNSVDVAWNLLMDSRYELLRGAIYCNKDELLRFRQLVVNSLMATDIFDKKLAALRKGRWEKAFSQKIEEHPQVAINRKATIVIEHIIQASDVSHTMQHWHVYSKWNEKLFHEMLKAYCEGRSDTDPAANWYQGELWFFDNYVIPLAGKLKECGVFGVSSDEYLQYAVANRREWESKGEEVVKQNTEKYLKLLPSRREEDI